MISARKSVSRTCVSCRTCSDKQQFIRLVRRKDNQVEIDSTGRKSGRGAYLCAKRDCVHKAITSDRLSQALRTKVSSENYDRLKEEFLHILKEQGE